MKVGDVRATLEKLTQSIGANIKDIMSVSLLLDGSFARQKEDDDLTVTELDKLKVFYQQRWDKVALTKRDYTSTQQGVNCLLIELAEQLANDKRVPDAYQLLMPTLLTNIDSISGDPCTNWPLDKFIINDAKTALIHVDAMKTAEGVRKGYTVADMTYQLTTAEHRRLALKDSALLVYKTLNVQHSQKLTQETVLAIKQLVESVVTKLGASDDLPEKSREFQAVIKAVSNFLTFTHQLNQEEHDALMGHYVYNTSELPVTFQVFINDMWGTGPKTGLEDLCTTTQMRSLAMLVVDYIPNVVFDNETVQKWAVEKQWSDRSLHFDYSTRVPFKSFDLSEKVSRRRCLYLLVDILSRPFSVVGGVDIKRGSLPACRVPQTAQALYEKIIEAMSGHISFARAYFDVVANLTPGAQRKVSRTRSADTQVWLDSIVDQSYWNRDIKSAPYKDLAINLLLFLNRETSLSRTKVEKYSDDIIRVFSMADTWMNVDVMALCRRCYHDLNKEDKRRFEEQFKHVSAANTDGNINQQIIDVTMYRAMHYLSFKREASSLLVFAVSAVDSNSRLRSDLQTYYNSNRPTLATQSLAALVKSFVDDLPERLQRRVSVDGREKMTDFLSKLSPRVWPSVEEPVPILGASI